MIVTRACRSFQLCGNRRCFSVAIKLGSGHNRWSKIKHDKAKEDASVTRQRSALAGELQRISKENGPDPRMNPRLADALTRAKKLGFPKASIESAIARGQGVSPSGIALESLSIEAMIPPSVSVIVECQTDSKARTLTDLRLAVKESKGTVTPTNHMFERKGKIVFENIRNIDEAEIFDRTIEAGAIDVEIEDEGNVVILTDPSQTTAVASSLAQTLGFKIKDSEIIWDPKEDMMVDVDSSENLESFLDRVHNDSCVQEVYTNARSINV